MEKTLVKGLVTLVYDEQQEPNIDSVNKRESSRKQRR